MGWRRAVFVGGCVLIAACSGSRAQEETVPGARVTAARTPASPVPVPATPTPAPPVNPVPQGPSAPPQTLVFQPAFHQALRWSSTVSETMTLRVKLPLGRAASCIRVGFRAGDGALTIVRAFIGLAGTGGAFARAPVPLAFDGQGGVAIAQARGVARSDAVPFSAAFHDDVYVSVVLRGQAAASAIDNLPDSFCYPGDQADAASPDGATPCPRGLAVQTLETEAPPTRAFLALGDSITEAYVDGPADYRKSWPAVLEAKLGLPVLNSGVSGQGVDGPLLHFENDVGSIPAVTDCIVLLGTNDLCTYSAGKLEAHLTMLYDQLRPRCRVWTATLTPREQENDGDLAVAQSELRQINAWLLARGQDPVIDFGAATRDPDHPDDWLPPFEMDGVHPNDEGAAAMAEAAARAITATK